MVWQTRIDLTCMSSKSLFPLEKALLMGPCRFTEIDARLPGPWQRRWGHRRRPARSIRLLAEAWLRLAGLTGWQLWLDAAHGCFSKH